jgi:membrane protein implicated in regulation of membrane protease activity
MDYTYQFESHLREHRPSRSGQRVWWMPAAAGVAVVVAEAVYLAATPLGQLSYALAVALPFIGAALFLVAWVALSIADWTYPSEKHYREVQHAAASQARAYILAGRRARGERPMPRKESPNRVPLGPAKAHTSSVMPAPARAAASRKRVSTAR